TAANISVVDIITNSGTTAFITAAGRARPVVRCVCAHRQCAPYPRFPFRTILALLRCCLVFQALGRHDNMPPRSRHSWRSVREIRRSHLRNGPHLRTPCPGHIGRSCCSDLAPPCSSGSRCGSLPLDSSCYYSGDAVPLLLSNGARAFRKLGSPAACAIGR